MDQSMSAVQAMHNRQLTRATQVLIGIVTGIVADGELHTMEIQMLNTWLTSNSEVARVWPGSAVAQQLREILADGVVTPDEKAYFLKSLQQLVGADFAETGAVSPGTEGLPYDHDVPISFKSSAICFTGDFLYGTRSACEKLSEKAGALTLASVSKKVHYLVIGTHVSPQWVGTSYGRKIQAAMELKTTGHGIAIIPERRWLDGISVL